MGGTPIEWFCVDNDVPTIPAPPVLQPAQVRPAAAQQNRDDDDVPDDTYIISNDGWFALDSKQIAQLPWMAFHRANPYSRICFNRNDRVHYTVNRITSSGAIWFDQCATPAYILKNYRQPSQLKLIVNMRSTQLYSVTCDLADSTQHTYMYDTDGTFEVYVDMPYWREYDDHDYYAWLYQCDSYDYDYEWD